jgi:hypothetical protein
MNQPCESGRGRILGPLSRRRLRRLPAILSAAALALAAVGVTSTPALAYGPPVVCGGRAEAAVFAPWGDSASYFLVPNGDFENGSSDWALTGAAQVVSDNDSIQVSAAADTHSLRLPPDSSAESRTVCVSTGEDAIRLFVMNPHVPGSILHVDAITRNPTTGAYGYAAFDVNGDVPSDLWAPTMRLGLPKTFGGAGTQELTLVFTLRGTRATWAIDDVYIDPFKSW